MIASPECGYLNTSPPAFDVHCDASSDPHFLTHTYIMGFQFNPTGGSYVLAASALSQAASAIDPYDKSY